MRRVRSRLCAVGEVSCRGASAAYVCAHRDGRGSSADVSFARTAWQCKWASSSSTARRSRTCGARRAGNLSMRAWRARWAWRAPTRSTFPWAFHFGRLPVSRRVLTCWFVREIMLTRSDPQPSTSALRFRRSSLVQCDLLSRSAHIKWSTRLYPSSSSSS